MVRTNKKYYYHHDDSDSVWWSYKDPSNEFNDGCVNLISKKRAKELAKELGLKKIPNGNG